jgi:hypothetical protein
MTKLALATALVLAAPPAMAGDEDYRISTRTADFDLSRQPEEPQPAPAPRFGAQGSEWWTVGAGLASDFSKATDASFRGAYSTFLVENVEFSAELNAWYFNQSGPNAFGLNPAILFRWHFYNEGPWTLFADVGIGLLLATDSVPRYGTAFNFTPRAGIGFTRELDEDTRTRLQVGLRWHHVSNARLTGEGDNPARDGLMLYAGLQFPF